MVVILESIGPFLQKVRCTPGLTGTGYFDQDGEQILTVCARSDGGCGVRAGRRRRL
jgi:hypothetical protein